MNGAPRHEAPILELMLPEGWVEMPLDEAGAKQHLAERLGVLRETPEWSPVLERRFVICEEMALNELRTQGVVHLAAMNLIESSTESDGSRSDVLHSAVHSVAMLTAQAIGSPVALTPDVLVKIFGASPASGDEEPRTVNLEPPAILDTTQGETVVLHRTVAARELGGRQLYLASFLTPIEQGDQLMVSQFATAEISEAATYRRLFEAIQSTLTLRSPAQAAGPS